MNKNIARIAQAVVAGAALAGLCGCVTQAVAAPPPWSKGRPAVQRQYDDARVIAVDPIVTRVRVESPRRECWEEVQTVQAAAGPHAETAGPMILGGIIGGVIGSQVGHGRGQDAATVAGTLIGAAIGHDAAVRRSGSDAAAEERVVERCRTRIDDSWQERIDGYRVTYEYLGREYETELPYDPGDRIRVQVAVAPAEY
jgi:uncharacterized protein YcfJ